MTRSGPFVTAVLAALMAAGCGTSPPVRYYDLVPIEDAYRPDPDASPVLLVGPLSMPQYLARPQMVSRGAGAEIIVDDFNRWAEALDQAIPRVIASNVDKLLTGVVAVAFPHRRLPAAHYRLTGSITRFDTDKSGQADLIVRWEVIDADGNGILSSRRSGYTAQAGGSSGAGAIAQAMNETLSQFSREIARELESALHE